jgi:hypothetical protein
MGFRGFDGKKHENIWIVNLKIDGFFKVSFIFLFPLRSAPEFNSSTNPWKRMKNSPLPNYDHNSIMKDEI